MSDTQTIQFELVSPEAKLVSEPVRMAVIPGGEGEFGVLAGHSSLVAVLKPGVIELSSEGDHEKQFFIAGGFADVTPEQCTVLAEEAVPVSALDRDALEQQAANLQEDIGIAVADADKARIQKSLDLVNAKLEAVAA